MNDHRHGTAKVALPGCTPLESLILRQLVAWYTEFSDSASTGASYNPPPTTKGVTEYLRVSHRDALAIMNRLEMRGLLRKERRLSAGASGHGYDGSLHSAAYPTQRAQKLVAAHP